MDMKSVAEHNKRMIEKAKQAGANILEWDDGIIVGFGTDEQYDTHAVQVMNHEGYYNEDGIYVPYRRSYDD